MTLATVVKTAFAEGMELGKQGVFRGDLGILPGEDGVIEIIRNLTEVAIEGELTEKLLYQDVGIVVGYVLSHPGEF
jgi:hypothetical protein